MNDPTANRGQPLRALALIMGVWLIGRVALWEPPFTLQAAPPALIAASESTVAPPSRPLARSALQETAGIGAGALPSIPVIPAPVRRAPEHTRPVVAAFANLALPATIGRLEGAGGNHAPAVRLAPGDRPLLGTLSVARPPPERRVSADAWLVWRDEASVPVAPGFASYGRSQAGAVVRYRLAPANSLQPTLYARVARALAGPRQGEAAAGLSAKPLARLPVTIAIEGRVTDGSSGRELRPAAFAVTQLPSLELPAGMRAEAYIQAGWVGGRDATAFVDGQARLDRRFVRLGDDHELRAGLAAWGGAQEGASRLDVGPSATLGFKIGGAQSRVAVDYRLRVAGDAAPASGPAVTFSAGF